MYHSLEVHNVGEGLLGPATFKSSSVDIADPMKNFRAQNSYSLSMVHVKAARFAVIVVAGHYGR
jgi:hypothetical protein